MNIADHLLTLITFLPAIGAFLLLFVPGNDEAGKNLARWVALLTSLVTFALSLWMWSRYDASNPGFQFVENYEWIGASIGYRMGVDGVSILFVVLTALLIPACLLSSWNSITTRVREYMIIFLILETLCIGVF
ncbi:MAG: NADH-quinone oxidoreductase subunit M, partial [Devosia sp.]